VKKYIIFIQCMIYYWHFYSTASSSALLAVWSTHFYLNFNWHGVSRTVPLFLLHSKFSSTGITFIHRLFGSKWIFSQAIFCKIPGHCQHQINEFVVFQDGWEPCSWDTLVYFHDTQSAQLIFVLDIFVIKA